MNPPAPRFASPFVVELAVNFDSLHDLGRQMAAEIWCCYGAAYPWYFTTVRHRGLVRFVFADIADAAAFRRRHQDISIERC